MKQTNEYTDKNIRAASPEKCKHPVKEVPIKQEVSYGRVYFWYECPLCMTQYGQGSYDF